jgi:hypothetical protein
MKNFLSFSFLLCTISPAFTQATKMVRDISGGQYNRMKQIYSVLRDNDTIKHGSYKRYRNEVLTEAGSYNKNQKDGTWKYYSKGQLISEKEFISGTRFGTWKFYKQDGSIEWAYDCNSNTFSGMPLTVKAIAIEDEKGEWISDPNLANATRLSGLLEWASFLNETLRYPQAAIDAGVQGTVQVEITMDTTGLPVEYDVALPAKMELVPESLRVVRIYKPEIAPYVKDGKKVRVKIRLPLTYRLGRG